MGLPYEADPATTTLRGNFVVGNYGATATSNQSELIHPCNSSQSSLQSYLMGTESDKKCILHGENGDDKTTNWRSIYVAAALSFVGSVQFSLYFSSLWPYLQIVDTGATENFFGVIVAIYSVGQIISAPTFGFWSNKIKQVRLPLYVGLTLMLIGNATYIALEAVTFPRRYLMLVGRLITGAGSGNVVLLRTYASTASTFKDRPRAIAYVTCGQALGMTCGPVFQLIFTPLPYPGLTVFNVFSFNMYTAPAYFACLMNIAGMLSIKFLFKETYAGIVEAPKDSDSGMPVKLPSYDWIAVFVCYISRFTQMFINTNLETLGNPFSMMMFGFNEDEAVTYTAAAQSFVGVFTFITYLAYIALNLERYIKSRIVTVGSLIGLVIFHLVTYSWPFLPGTVPMHSSNVSAVEDKVGCNYEVFEWCADLAPVNVWLYYITYVLVIGFAFPALNITTTTLFSKVLGPRRQGTQQGIFQVCGGAARMIGPLAISNLYTFYGPRMAWNMEIVVISLTLLAWVVFYRRMVPLNMPQIPASSESSCEESAASMPPRNSQRTSSSSLQRVTPVDKSACSC